MQKASASEGAVKAKENDDRGGLSDIGKRGNAEKVRRTHHDKGLGSAVQARSVPFSAGHPGLRLGFLLADVY